MSDSARRGGAGSAAQPPSGPRLEPTNDVERALAAALENPERAGDFLELLADAQVQVPVTGPPATDGRVGFPTFTRGEVSFACVYTSLAALAASGYGDGPRIELTGRALAGMWPPTLTMSLNGGTGLQQAIPPVGVAELTRGPDGVGTTQLAAGTEVTVSVPPVEPVQMLARMRAEAPRWPAIRELHRAWVEFPGGEDPPRIFVGVVVDPSAQATEIDAAVRALAVAAGPEVSLMPLRPAATDPINRWLRGQAHPFYIT